MADLQKFKDFLAQAEALDKDIVELESKRTNLEGDVVTLTAKQQYLQGSVEGLKETIIDLTTTKNSAVAQSEAEVILLETRKATLQNDIGQLERSMKSAEASYAAELTRSNRSEADQRKIIADLQATIQDIESQKHIIQSQVDESSVQLAQIAKQVADSMARLAECVAKEQEANDLLVTQQTTAQNVISVVTEETRQAKKALEEAVNTLDEVRIATAEAEKKHDGYKDYERRANKVLEAREQAILAREKELTVEVTQTRRRNSILGQVPV